MRPLAALASLSLLVSSGCRLGYDSLPGQASDDAGPSIDADPLAPDADPAAPDAAKPQPDAGPSAATTTQSGEHSPTSPSDLISIDPVLLSESFVTCSRRSTASTPNLNAARCQLIDGSTLRIASGSTDNSAVTAWTVTQVPGAVVHRGTETLGATDLTRDVTFPAIDLARTFALVSASSPFDQIDNDERTNIMAHLESETTIRLSRGDDAVAATAEYQIIELPTASVQSGVANFASAEPDLSISLNTVDLSRTFVVHSTSIGADVDGEEALYMTRSALSTDSLTFSRQGSSEPLQLAWFAVELPAPSTVITTEVLSTPPHDQMSFEFVDAAFAVGMLSFSSLEIASGVLRSSLNAASFTAVMSAERLTLERSASDGSQVHLRTTVVDIVMP